MWAPASNLPLGMCSSWIYSAAECEDQPGNEAQPPAAAGGGLVPESEGKVRRLYIFPSCRPCAFQQLMGKDRGTWLR
jgi:hypothetical protein